MNSREKGFALLTCYLGDPRRKILTVAQFRVLAQRVRQGTPNRSAGELEERDLLALGYDGETAHRIVELLSQEQQLMWYVQKGREVGCRPITRISEQYPQALRKRLGLDAPACLWAKGDLSLLGQPAVALVGSRELRILNQAFAQEAGEQIARQGYVLISGNARGADKAAQDSCLAHGGRVISVVADRLDAHPEQPGVLYLSEDGFDLGFSAQRALSRNRCIHALGISAIAAQCSLQTGGTWDGSVKNLRFGWTPLYIFDDGSESARLLCDMGATMIGFEDLKDLWNLPSASQMKL